MDTETGTAFYGISVDQRAVHPGAFDFDVLYTKSITETLDAVRKLKPAEGETQYEPDILIRLEAHKTGRKKNAIPIAHVEKDRTGILQVRLENRFEHEHGSHLHHAISDRRYAQRSLFAVRLRDPYPPHRTGLVS